MRNIFVALLLSISLTTPLWAQETAGLPTSEERQTAHIASWVTVLTAEAFDVWATAHADNLGRAITLHAVRIGVVEGSVFALKHYFPDARPCTPTHTCGSDGEMSGFPSGHMALACSTFGGPSLSITLPLAGGTGLGRNLAGRHFWRQIGAGCLVGSIASLIR
jgi:membrane-associated phospholipid phosphatase